MLTKYLTLLPLGAMASAAALSSHDEALMKHQYAHEDPHADDFSHQIDLVKRDGGYVSLPLFKRKGNYAMDLFMGSREKKLVVDLTMSTANLWVNDGTLRCTEYTKRELQSKRNISVHDPKDSQSVVPQHNNGSDEVKQSGDVIPHFGDMNKQHQRECKAWTRSFVNWTESNTIKLHPSLKDTFNPGNNWFIRFHTKDQADNSCISDKVGTSKTKVNMIFAVVDIPRTGNGFLGLACPDWKVRQMDGKYASFPEALKNAGYIQKLTYSLFLNEEDSKGGSILFGAVDHKKYVGKLQTVRMLDVFERKSDGIAIVLNQLYLENSSQKVVLLNDPVLASLETTGGDPLFPSNTFFALVESMQIVNELQSNVYQVDCEYRNSTGNLVYGFSGITIKIPIKELVREKNGICYLAAKPHSKNSRAAFSLSNSFLRYVYLNVDLEAEEVSMAQAKFSDQEEIEKITTTVPRAVKAEQYWSLSIVPRVGKPKVDIFRIVSDE